MQPGGLSLLVPCIHCGLLLAMDFGVILTDCSLLQASDASARESIEKVVEVLCGEPMSSFNDCIKWAVLRFQVRPLGPALHCLVSSAWVLLPETAAGHMKGAALKLSDPGTVAPPGMLASSDFCLDWA